MQKNGEKNQFLADTRRQTGFIPPRLPLIEAVCLRVVESGAARLKISGLINFVASPSLSYVDMLPNYSLRRVSRFVSFI